jgi:hypothetical protein
LRGHRVRHPQRPRRRRAHAPGAARAIVTGGTQLGPCAMAEALLQIIRQALVSSRSPTLDTGPRPAPTCT